MWRKVALVVAALTLVGLWLVNSEQPAAAARRHRTTTTTVAMTPLPPNNGTVWQPASRMEWQWEIDHPLSLSSSTDMGVGVTAWNGDRSPGTNPAVYDIDGILNPASTVAALHRINLRSICYIEVGTAGNYYSAADEGVPTSYFAQLQAAGDLGNKLSGYPEYFIDINSPSAVSIIETMISQQCASKGFDAVETDLDETFGNNEGSTGFTITQANEENYLETLATYMHSVGLAWFAKNPDDTGSQSFVTDIEPYSQGVITEQCNQYGTCPLLRPYLSAGKPVLNAEYSGSLSAFCPADISAGINGALFPQSLNGTRSPCS